jgi:multimeric flavodoxin WrbA
VLANYDSDSSNTYYMLQSFIDCITGNVEIINLKGLIKSGCKACYRCTENYRCVFDKADGFANAYKKIIEKADILVFADSIHDRHLSAEFKYFVDRTFVVNHTPRLPGKKVGFLISGPLNQMPEVRHSLEAWVEVNDGTFIGVVCDDENDNKRISNQIDTLAERLVAVSEKGYSKPRTFEGVAARKIYRDETWGELRQVFVADHQYYKKNGYYDFPQKNIGLRLYNIMMGILNKIPFFRSWLIKNVQSIKASKYKKVLNDFTIM